MQDKMTLGQYLQEVRKEKSISIDEICRETNISKKYLMSLEADDFDAFPGDTYILGFLSTYADALEIDREKVLSMYRRQMRIEQDAPIEQLVGTQKKQTNINPAYIAAVVGGLLLVVILSFFVASRNSALREKNSNSVKTVAQTFYYTQDNVRDVANQKFQIGDTIYITNNFTLSNTNSISNVTKVTEILFNRLGISKTLELKINKKMYQLKEGSVLNIDSDGNSIDDMGVEVFSIKDKKISISVAILKEEVKVKPEQTVALSPELKEDIMEEIVLMTSDVRTPVKMVLRAVGTGWMGYTADGGEEKQVYVKKDMEMEVTFNDKLELQLGNAGAVDILVGGKEEKGGAWGDVNKSVIYWKQSGNKFNLVRAILK